MKRNETIDALRGIAALAVVVEHLFSAAYRQTTSQLIRQVSSIVSVDYLDWGRFGVVVFFLISGYVVPEYLVRGGSMSTFLRQRLFRILPAFWVSMAIVIIVNWLLYDRWPRLDVILANATLAPNLFRVEWPSGVYWTLNIELIFYFLCVCGAGFGVLRGFWPVFLVQFGLVFLFVVPSVINSLFDRKILPIQFTTYYVSFLLCGVLMRIIHRERLASTGWLLLAALPFYFVPVAAGLVFPIPTLFSVHGPIPSLTAHVAALLVFVIVVVLNKVRIGGWWLRLGRISYSLYLFHWPLCALVIALIGFGDGIQTMLTISISVAVSLLAASFLFRAIEAPSIRAGHRTRLPG